MGVLGAVPSGGRGMELHRHGRDGILQPDVQLQELASGSRTDRPAKYSFLDLVLLRVDVKFSHRQGHYEVAVRKKELQ